MKNLTERKKSAFTLAEILITLAVIGIVAAMTIPNLIQSYKKKVVETKLVNFYSTINQAFQLSEIDNGQAITWEKIPKDEEGMKDWFGKYLLPYIKSPKVESSTNEKESDIKIYFPDGSFLRYYGDAGYILQYSSIGKPKGKYGVDWFYFVFSPSRGGKQAVDKNKLIIPLMNDMHNNIETIKENCGGKMTGDTGGGAYCTYWIMLNGWKIPEDYPYKF